MLLGLILLCLDIVSLRLLCDPCLRAVLVYVVLVARSLVELFAVIAYLLQLCSSVLLYILTSLLFWIRRGRFGLFAYPRQNSRSALSRSSMSSGRCYGRTSARCKRISPLTDRSKCVGRVLLTGDLSNPGNEVVMKVFKVNFVPFWADIAKCGWHGDGGAMLETWAKFVGAICWYWNYHHAMKKGGRQNTLKKLLKAGVKEDHVTGLAFALVDLPALLAQILP